MATTTAATRAPSSSSSTEASHYESQLGARLSLLETKLGVRSSATSNSTATSSGNSNSTTREAGASSLADRLASLERQVTSTLSAHSAPHQESLQLLNELNPGVALTHQQQPLLYRRQQVLAAAPSLQHDFTHLHELHHVLRMNTGAGDSKNQDASSKGIVTEDQVVHAPLMTIVTDSSSSTMVVSPEQERRLDAIQLVFGDALKRTQAMQGKVDRLLEAYHVAMVAASEKSVLATRRQS